MATRWLTSRNGLIIPRRRGRDVSALSVKPEEQEVLFRTGSRFRVAGRRKEGDLWLIEL